MKHWLDAEVAKKINFTKSTSDLLQFVHEENLQAHYGGKDNWQYTYIEPKHGENEYLGDGEKEAEIRAERDELARQFERLTLEWAGVDHQSDEGKKKDEERQKAAHEIQENYWKLDPYIRARTYYHRAGTLDAITGKLDLKPTQ